jgi:hypothetical protein
MGIQLIREGQIFCADESDHDANPRFNTEGTETQSTQRKHRQSQPGKFIRGVPGVFL